MTEQGARLREQYGQPEPLDLVATLHLFGLVDEVDPRNAVAFRYLSREAADAFAHANTEKGHTVHRGVDANGWPAAVIELHIPERPSK